MNSGRDVAVLVALLAGTLVCIAAVGPVAGQGGVGAQSDTGANATGATASAGTAQETIEDVRLLVADASGNFTTNDIPMLGADPGDISDVSQIQREYRVQVTYNSSDGWTNQTDGTSSLDFDPDDGTLTVASTTDEGGILQANKPSGSQTDVDVNLSTDTSNPAVDDNISSNEVTVTVVDASLYTTTRITGITAAPGAAASGFDNKALVDWQMESDSNVKPQVDVVFSLTDQNGDQIPIDAADTSNANCADASGESIECAVDFDSAAQTLTSGSGLPVIEADVDPDTTEVDATVEPVPSDEPFATADSQTRAFDAANFEVTTLGASFDAPNERVVSTIEVTNTGDWTDEQAVTVTATEEGQNRVVLDQTTLADSSAVLAPGESVSAVGPGTGTYSITDGKTDSVIIEVSTDDESSSVIVDSMDPASFDVANVSTQVVREGRQDAVQVDYDVTNTGDFTDTQTLTLRRNGTPTGDTTQTTLGPGETASGTLTTTNFPGAGTYQFSVASEDGLAGDTLTVTPGTLDLTVTNAASNPSGNGQLVADYQIDNTGDLTRSTHVRLAVLDSGAVDRVVANTSDPTNSDNRITLSGGTSVTGSLSGPLQSGDAGGGAVDIRVNATDDAQASSEAERAVPTMPATVEFTVVNWVERSNDLSVDSYVVVNRGDVPAPPQQVQYTMELAGSEATATTANRGGVETTDRLDAVRTALDGFAENDTIGPVDPGQTASGEFTGNEAFAAIEVLDGLLAEFDSLELRGTVSSTDDTDRYEWTVEAQSPDCANVSYAGAGTAQTPYEVGTLAQLQCLDQDLTASYEQVADIDASATAAWNDGDGFEPIGNPSAAFNATFDGNGHTVSNLVIDRPGVNAVGLFGAVSPSGTVTDLRLTNATVTGDENLGVLVGENQGTVENASVAGTVTGNESVGALGGANWGPSGVVRNATATGTITGGPNSQKLGGLVGVSGGQVVDSRAMASVSGSFTLGGVVGFNSGPVRNATATGGVTGSRSPRGSADVGGLVGRNTATVTASTASGTVTGSSNVGGLVGWNDIGFNGLETTVRNSTATGAVEPVGESFTVGGLVGRNDGTVAGSTATGNITNTDADTVGGLVGSNGLSRSAVRNSSASGTVEGDFEVGGLIGRNGGTVANSTAMGAVDGNVMVGGLAGAGEGTVTNSTAMGAVNGSTRVGGFVGRYSGTLTESTATGAVNGSTGVGGFVGVNTGTVNESSATGNVTGAVNAGGFVGQNGAFADGRVETAYATGTVTGIADASGVGGFVGNNTAGRIARTYATGAVTGSSDVGGLAGGTNDSGATVTGSYWDQNTTGQTDSAGGTGLTTAEMTGPAARENLSALDFEGVWQTVPGDYPQIDPLPVLVDDHPRDIDADGRYEDIRGDGTFDILDVQALFNNLESRAVQTNVGAFRFFDNHPDPEEVNILDVQGLFDDLQRAS